MSLDHKLRELDPIDRFSPSAGEMDVLRSITTVSRETIQRLTIYNALLNRWQTKTNLVARNTLPDYWSRHVADSLQLISIVDQSAEFPRNWLDLGSGGGFPGLVLAIILAEKATCKAQITLVESIQKKCSFLRRVVSETGINEKDHVAIVVCSRIESAVEQFEGSDVITARALASLEKLLTLTGEYLVSDSAKPRYALFHKGRDFQMEVEESRGKWDFDLIVHPSRIDAESVVLEISNVRPKG